MFSPLLAVASEIHCLIFSFLEVVDVSSLRLTCHQLETQTRHDFAQKYLNAPRIKLTTRHLSSFLQICNDLEIASAIKQLHISLYMPDRTSGDALRRIQLDSSPLELGTHCHLQKYVDTYLAEQSFDTATTLSNIFLLLKNLRGISLSATLQDITEFTTCEKNILKALSTTSYKRYHHEGRWRFMTVQSTRVISTTLRALTMANCQIERLVIDRRLYTTQLQRATVLSRVDLLDNNILGQNIHTSSPALQSIRTLDLSISEHCMPAKDLRNIWIMSLITTAPSLQELRLMFHHPATLAQLDTFLDLRVLRQLKRLSISSLSRIQNSASLVAFSNQLAGCLIEVSVMVFSDGRIFKEQENMPNLRLQTNIEKPNYGQFWFSDMINCRRRRNDWTSVRRV